MERAKTTTLPLAPEVSEMPMKAYVGSFLLTSYFYFYLCFHFPALVCRLSVPLSAIPWTSPVYSSTSNMRLIE